MKIATPLFLFCFTVATLAQTPSDSGLQRTFKPVERIGDVNERAFFVFASGDLMFTVRHDGLGDTTATKFLRNRKFRLQVGEGRLVRLNVAEFEGDSILAYEVSIGRSYLARLDQNTRAIRWLVQLGPQIGPGLIEDKYAYVSGQGFVAKIDMETGNYVWQLPNLKPKSGDGLREFGLPQIRGSAVFFREVGTGGRTLELDKNTGEIRQPL